MSLTFIHAVMCIKSLYLLLLNSIVWMYNNLLGLFPVWNYYKGRCYKHHIQVSVWISFHFSWVNKYLKLGLVCHLEEYVYKRLCNIFPVALPFCILTSKIWHFICYSCSPPFNIVTFPISSIYQVDSGNLLWF